MADSRERPGAVVGHIHAGSAADKIGIRAGDIIVEINKQKVAGAGDVKRILAGVAPGAEIVVTFARDGWERSDRATI